MAAGNDSPLSDFGRLRTLYIIMNMTSSAPAKTILFGEHAVVYGEPAIAIPLLNIRTYAKIHPSDKEFRLISENTGMNTTYNELDPASGIKKLLDLLMDELSISNLPPVNLQISSDIPIASGLGSGAALSVAVIREFSQYFQKHLSNERINEIAFEIEKIYHGFPSGIDNTTITYETPIIFSKSDGFTRLTADISKLPLLIIDSGIHSETVNVVSDVKKNYDNNKTYIKEIGSLVKTAKEALGNGNLKEIGKLMNENQRLLSQINVSCKELDHYIGIARQNGALGSKLTGAGRGGNFIVLAGDPEHRTQLKSIYESMGLRVFL